LESFNLNLKKEIGNFLIVSAAYIVSFTLVGGFVGPLQSILLPQFTTSISLLFLPHGVRLLAVHYFGWKAIPLLLPSCYLMWAITVFGSGIAIDPLQPLASLVACYLGYKLMSLIISGSQARLGRQEWKLLIAAGILCSFLNGLANSLLHGSSQLSLDIFGYMIGDIFGQIALMLILIYVLKFIRLFKA
jgi:hypothetical protein